MYMYITDYCTRSCAKYFIKFQLKVCYYREMQNNNSILIIEICSISKAHLNTYTTRIQYNTTPIQDMLGKHGITYC